MRTIHGSALDVESFNVLPGQRLNIAADSLSADDIEVPELSQKDLEILDSESEFINDEPVYQTNTTNRSFYYMAGVLKSIGIENNKFHLTLYDKRLLNVDPFDPDLSEELQEAVMQEMSCNFWYFVRECVRIPNNGKFIKFQAHIGNLSVFFCLLRNYSVYLEQSRQTGKTLAIILFDAWVFGVRGRGTDILFAHFIKEYAITNKNNVLDILNALPPYAAKLHKLTFKIDKKTGLEVFTEKGESGQKVSSVKHELLNNTITVVTPGTSEDKARKAGRSRTAQIVMLDEIGFVKYNSTMIDAISQTYATAADMAKKNGMHYSMQLLTTPPKLGTRAGDFLYQLVFEDSAFFYPKLFDEEDKIETYIRSKKSNYLVIRYHYYELGFPESWAVKRKGDAATVEGFMTEVMLRWSKGSDDNPFDQITLHRLDAVTQGFSPDLSLLEDKYDFRFYEDINSNTPVVIAADVSQGVGQDSSTIVAVNAYTGGVISTFKSNVIDTTLFGKLIMKFAQTFFPQNKKCIVVERNGPGGGAISTILNETKYPGFNSYLFAEPVSSNTLSVNSGFSQVTRNNKKMIYGVHVTGDKRYNEIYGSNFINIVKHRPELIRCDYIASQINTLITKPGHYRGIKTTYITHDEGKHDDVLYAYMHAIRVLTMQDPSILGPFGIQPLNPMVLKDKRYLQKQADDKRIQRKISKRQKELAINPIEAIREYKLTGDTSNLKNIEKLSKLQDQGKFVDDRDIVVNQGSTIIDSAINDLYDTDDMW